MDKKISKEKSCGKIQNNEFSQKIMNINREHSSTPTHICHTNAHVYVDILFLGFSWKGHMQDLPLNKQGMVSMFYRCPNGSLYS